MVRTSAAALLGEFCFAVQSSRIVTERMRRNLLRAGGGRIGPGARLRPGCRFFGSAFAIGRDSFVNYDCMFDLSAPIHIGQHVTLSFGVLIVTATHRFGPATKRADAETIGLPVRIEDGCWIGARAVILPGVTIARGCVIGAGALVTKSTEPNGIYAGNPARRMRELPEGGIDISAFNLEFGMEPKR